MSEITYEIKKSKLSIILGGSQDLTYANYKGYEKLEQPINLTCIDQGFDVVLDQEDQISSDNYINHLLLDKLIYYLIFQF